MDKISIERIQKLHPSVRNEVKLILEECNNALTKHSKLRITHGLRTFAEQDALYNKKPKVTNAKGGQSIHNYGFAVDIVLLINQKEISYEIKKDWDDDGISDWIECVNIFKKHNWSWGGDWKKFKDSPHFEKVGFHNWRDLIDKKKDKNNYIIL